MKLKLHYVKYVWFFSWRLSNTIQSIPMAEFSFTGSLCLKLCVAKLESPDKGLCNKPCQHRSWEFIFGKSCWPQHSTYPVQSRHWVAWQLLHLPNPAGSQSEPANMQHDGAWTKQVSEGLAIWWQQPISMGKISARGSCQWKGAEISAG